MARLQHTAYSIQYTLTLLVWVAGGKEVRSATPAGGRHPTEGGFTTEMATAASA